MTKTKLQIMREKKGKMSKIQETAPEEIFLIVGPIDDTDFKELSDVTWADKPIHEETAIKYIKQTKLSIPKKIAEELLEGDKIKHPSYELMFNEDGEWSEELQEWMETTDKWWAIVDAYLAGKTLGVELVEVEG